MDLALLLRAWTAQTQRSDTSISMVASEIEVSLL